MFTLNTVNLETLIFWVVSLSHIYFGFRVDVITYLLYLFLLHYIVFNNDEWSAGFVLDSNGTSWNYKRQLALVQLYKQKTEPNKEQDVQYPLKELQHSLLHDLQVSKHTIKFLQEALLVAEQREQGMYKML